MDKDKEISDLFGKPNPGEKYPWDTGLLINGSQVGKIIRKNGKETGYMITGRLCPTIIDKKGEPIAMLCDIMAPKILTMDGRYTGYSIIGSLVKRIYYNPHR